MNRAFFEKDILSFVEAPDKNISEKYDKAFENLNQSLKRDTDNFLEKERKRIQKTAQRAETYMLV